MKPDEIMPSPSPIRRVFGGRLQVEGMTMGFEPVAGSRMVDGDGVVIPAHGLGFAVVQVMLVPVPPGRPRASITAPLGYVDWTICTRT